MNTEPIKTPYLNGYRASQYGDSYNSNPYDQSRNASKYAWFAGFNDHKTGHKLDLDQFEDPLTHSVRLRMTTDMTLEQISEITGSAKHSISLAMKELGLTRQNRQLKANEVKLLMSNEPIAFIAAKLGMTNEQVSQHRYKQKQRDLKSNLENLKFGE